MSKRGQMGYIPVVIIDELEDLMREEEIQKKSDAFKQLVQHARVGREVQRLTSFGYNWKKKNSKRKHVKDFGDDLIPFELGGTR